MTRETFLPYSERSVLYTMFEYSTNIINTVGKKDSWTDKEGNVTTFGVELEVSTSYYPKDIVNAFPDIFAICKKDATISGSKPNMMEIVTIPASMRQHKKMWASFFRNTSVDNFDYLDKHTNGMHVHVDKKAFEDDQIHLKKFCWFFSCPEMREFNIGISERTKESLGQYAKFADKATGISNVERETRALSKHVVVNLSHAATVEVRLFKGIVSFTSIIKNIEFVDAAVEYTRSVSLAEINLGSFLNWLSALPTSRYRTLRICIESMDLDELSFNSSLAAFLRIPDPKVAFDRIKKGKFKFEEKQNKKVISGFNEQYGKLGYKISYSKVEGFTLHRQTTKFAQFDDVMLAMFRR